MPDGQKPLPPTPHNSGHSQSTLTTLTVEGRSHLSRFIKHALQEEGLGEDELWDERLEKALCVFGESVSHGDWLLGLKQARIAAFERRVTEKSKSDEVKALKESSKEQRAKGQGKDEKTVEDKSKAEDFFIVQRSEEERTQLALRQLSEVLERSSSPAPRDSPKHLLLTLSPQGAVLPLRDLGFDLVPGNTRCTFSAGIFTLPSGEVQSRSGSVLYGLQEWDVDVHDHLKDSVRVVGGTFSFHGLTTAAQFEGLTKVLRLSIFFYLSAILEQHFLSDSHVTLRFPPPPQHTAHSLPNRVQREEMDVKPKPSNPKPVSGLWSYVSKRTENLLQRATGTSFRRAETLDRPSLTRESPQTSASPSDSPRRQRLSFSILETPKSTSNQVSIPQELIYTSILKRIKESTYFLTTSTGLVLTPPRLLTLLAERETQDATRRPLVDERAGLRSLLGWEGKESAAKGNMSDTIPAFIRHQGFMALHSSHIVSASRRSGSSGSDPASGSALTTSTAETSTKYPPAQQPLSPVLCGRYRWVTSRFYSRRKDRSLGEFVTRLCDKADESCDTTDCKAKRGEHELRWIHGGVQIIATLEKDQLLGAGLSKDITMWASCSKCGRLTSRKVMHDGTYLYSFAKFLEQLIYSPIICSITPSICEHTSPSSDPENASSLPSNRLNIVRHFSHRARIVSFAVSEVPDIFELRVPKLQIIRDHVAEKSTGSSSDESHDSVSDGDDEKKVLRREIKAWWQGVAEHIDGLEERFAMDDSELMRKSLPRLPSVDDAYEESPPTTPKAGVSTLPPLPPSTPGSPSRHALSSEPGILSQPTTPAATYTVPTPSDPAGSSRLLLKLRHNFQSTEQSLYAQLSRTPTASLNDVRRAFRSSARGATKRLNAWQTKHACNVNQEETKLDSLAVEEPEWWKTGCHPVPGGHVIVREQEWSTIISFTLSSLDYQKELARMSVGRTSSSGTTESATSSTSHATALSTPPPASPASSNTSYFSSGGPYKLFHPTARPPDPDQESPAWLVDENCTAVITRKDHPRDPSALLSIRDVLRHQRGVDGTDAGLIYRLSNLNSSLNNHVSRFARAGMPSAAWAKPAVELDKQTVDGIVSGLPDSSQSVEKLLHELENEADMASSHNSSSSNSSASGIVETAINRDITSSVLSVDSDTTIGPGEIKGPLPPPKSTEQHEVASNSAVPDPPPTASTITNALTSGFSSVTYAMRQMLSHGDTSRPPSPGPNNHHTLLVTDSPPIGDRPHIKYDWTIGQRLKFSCTVYYAKQFDVLRRRCGVEDLLMKSLERSGNWSAEGGKSKSNFWKTSDDRFIIKTLVNAWNVADLQVLIELAPSYFRYMDSTANKPSVLAKLLGFFTVEIRNLETGTTQAKADLLVMENLFFNQNVSKTFDLKGIQGRKVKARAGSSVSNKTLFDGEWIEGQQRALMLIHAHSKFVLREAIKNDAAFLAKSNIMDYSLLLGVDDPRKQIACGVVDTIGSYTFAKTLEYKAKQGLNSGKEVTVIPPHEYEERFVTAMENYFLACPDKWSRPMDDIVISEDYKLLPSVL